MTFLCITRTEERPDYSASQTEINGEYRIRIPNYLGKLEVAHGRTTAQKHKVQRTGRNLCIKIGVIICSKQ